ncbi:MAG TPA: hypothetical protein VMI54_25535 [Polyangiaceae bacterium]|nr:hypothetical protein [Polyangiaceae bacterium]
MPARTRSLTTLHGLGAVLAVACGVAFALALASCGGSSSETPPPLEPSPQNVHYDRSATTLPGELGTPTRPVPVATTPAPAPTPFHPESAVPQPGTGRARPQRGR